MIYPTGKKVKIFGIIISVVLLYGAALALVNWVRYHSFYGSASTASRDGWYHEKDGNLFPIGGTNVEIRSRYVIRVHGGEAEKEQKREEDTILAAVNRYSNTREWTSEDISQKNHVLIVVVHYQKKADDLDSYANVYTIKKSESNQWQIQRCGMVDTSAGYQAHLWRWKSMPDDPYHESAFAKPYEEKERMK